MKSVLVFCGSNKGNHPVYETTAIKLGQTLAQGGIRIIYGGGNVGLMGVLADAALAEGGAVTGVIPHFLRTREVCHEGLTELVVVQSMAERKWVMAELADSVIPLPGGYGTLDELFEMLTLVQLSQAAHPIGLLNVEGFFDPLLAQLDRMCAAHFLKATHRQMLLAAPHIEGLLFKMKNFTPSTDTSKWLNRE